MTKVRKGQRAHRPRTTAPQQPVNDITGALTLAEQYNGSGKQERILEALAPIGAKYPFNDKLQCVNYNRLLAFGHAHLNQLIEAEAAVRRGLADMADCLDLYYVMCFVKLSLREYAEAIAAGETYLNLRTRQQADPSLRQAFASSAGHLSQLCNFVGVAYRDSGQTERATFYFEKAIVADAGNHLPYLNLANLHLTLKRHDTAFEVIRRGLSSCRQVHELRILEESARNHTTVSACMIVRNEEELLGRCLESIRDWVDEIIVVDTGSTDRTEEIAKSYGARVFHQSWEGDFSKHRNYSLEQAAGDWTLVIDADEEFCREDIARLRELLNQPQWQVISINVYNVYPDGHTTTFLPSIRLFRTKLNLRYQGIVHNVLKMPDDISAVRAPVRLNHYGYGLTPEKMRAKAARTRALLEKQLAENPDNAFALFNLAQLLRGEGEEFQEANAPIILQSAERAVAQTNPDRSEERSIHLMCLDQLGWTHFYRKQYDKAIEYARKALSLKSDYLDPMLLLGHAHARLGQYQEAAESYQRYLEVQAGYTDTAEHDNIILMHVDSRATAYYGLAVIGEILGRTDEAKRYYRLTMSVNPHHLDTAANLGRLLLAEGDLIGAEECFSSQLEADTDSVTALLGLGYVAYQRKNLREAERFYRRTLEIDSENSTALLRLGQICLQSDRDAEAAELFHRALSIGSSDAGIERQLAEIYFGLGRFAEAAACLDNLITRTSPTSELLNDLGNCYFRLNRLETAEQYYRRALTLSPVHNLAHRNLGATLARIGRVEEALNQLENYLGTPGADLAVNELAGDLCRQVGRYSEAISHYEKYLTTSGLTPQCLYGLSECYLQLGHRDSAILGYQRVLALDPGSKAAQQRINELLEPVLGSR